MGLFGKKKEPKNNTDVKKEKQPKKAKPPKVKKEKGKNPGKRSFFGGNKKEMTLLERMQLEESVAAASLSVVQELADSGDSAVREVDDGLLIVAISNDMLEEAGLDPNSEEFGSFAEALRSETIESIALADDLVSGVVGIIPSRETLISLDEFDFVHDLAFQWAIVPFDLSDEDRLMVLGTTVDIGRLMELADDASIQLDVKNSEVIEVTDEDAFPHDEEENEWERSDEIEDDLSDDDLLTDEFSEDEFPDDYPDEIQDEFQKDEMELDDDLLDDELEEEPLELDTAATEEEEMIAEERKETINRLIQHTFSNTELDLTIDMAKFDDYFDSIMIAQFDTTRQDNSELENILCKLRQDANIELSRFHQDNIQALRNKFTTSMRDIHNKLVESLDHKDVETTYGIRHHEIETTYQEAIDDLDRYIAGEVSRIQTEYNERREEYAENARREALAAYDSRYQDERNRKIERVKEDVEIDLKTTRDADLGELYKDRRTVARRLFDKATTSLLQVLQEEHQTIAQKELQMYDAFRKDMDAYLRKHFADEVLRAKAEAEKLKQSHEAERIRQEYEQMLTTKARQLEEADERAKEALRQLEGEHKEQMKHVKLDYERRLEREQRDNENMRELLEEATRSNSKISEQKEEEIKHRLKLYRDTIKAKDLELKYANERANASQKPLRLIIGAVAAVMLALGIIFGFLFGAKTTAQPTPQPQKQTEEPVSAAPKAKTVSIYV